MTTCVYNSVHIISAWSRVILDKLTVARLAKHFPHFMGRKSLLTIHKTQVKSIKSDESSSDKKKIMFLQDRFYYYFQTYSFKFMK